MLRAWVRSLSGLVGWGPNPDDVLQLVDCKSYSIVKVCYSIL